MSTAATQKLVAVIRETECIGCTKCIQVCPVDAILGSSRKMHTVIADECIGCKLCLPPCPVDCIDLITVPIPSISSDARKEKATQIKKRYLARQKRLESKPDSIELEARKTYVRAAVARARKNRKSSIPGKK